MSLFDLTQRYPTADAAMHYFISVRWPHGPVCAKCGHAEKITAQRKVGTYWCGSCRAYFTVFTHTPLERNKVDPRKWLFAAYLLLTARKGISSVQLSKELSVKQPTAWYMLHRLRVACEERSVLLSGIVEIDDTYVGGRERNKHGYKRNPKGIGGVGKQILMGMRERGGRLFARTVTDTRTENLMAAVTPHLAPEAIAWTDTHSGYRHLGRFVAAHGTVNHERRQYVNGSVHTNSIESVWAVFKRGVLGVYHSVSPKHLNRYAQEFMFRLNDGNCSVDTVDRLHALFRTMPGKTIAYKALTASATACRGATRRRAPFPVLPALCSPDEGRPQAGSIRRRGLMRHAAIERLPRYGLAGLRGHDSESAFVLMTDSVGSIRVQVGKMTRRQSYQCDVGFLQ